MCCWLSMPFDKLVVKVHEARVLHFASNQTYATMLLGLLVAGG